MRRPVFGKLDRRLARRAFGLLFTLLLLGAADLAGAADEAKGEGRVSTRERSRDRIESMRDGRDGRGGDPVERWRSAKPEERRAMRERMRERWEDATPRERRRFGRRMRALARALPAYSPIERLMLVRAAADLPPAELESLRERLRGIDDLKPDERARLLEEVDRLIASYGKEIQRLERNRDRWEGMSESERDQYREQMRRLRAMSLEERRKLLDEMEGAQAAP